MEKIRWNCRKWASFIFVVFLFGSQISRPGLGRAWARPVQITTRWSKLQPDGPNYNQAFQKTVQITTSNEAKHWKWMRKRVLHQRWQYLPNGQWNFNAGCNSDRLVSVVFNALIKGTSNIRIPRKLYVFFAATPRRSAILGYFSKSASPLQGSSISKLVLIRMVRMERQIAWQGFGQPGPVQ